MSEDPYRVATPEALRGVIGEPSPAVRTKIFPTLGDTEQAFIARSPFLLMATADAAGHVDVSPKGDGPGFVAVEDERTLLVPDRKGNRLAMGLENLLENPRLSLIFLVPGTGETLRVNGDAVLTRDPTLLERLSARGQPALLAVRVTVRECFFHCAKAFLRARLWEPEAWPERGRVSFGKLLAPRLGADARAAEAIDAAIEDDYARNL